MDQQLSIWAQIIKLLEENIGISLHDLEFDNGFLHMILKAQKRKIDWTSSKF